MLKFTCERCEKEFTSETDYEQHIFFEEQKALLEKIAESNRASWNIIYSQLNMLVLLTIDKNYSMRRDWDKVTKMYFDLNDAWNSAIIKRQSEDNGKGVKRKEVWEETGIRL